MSSKNPLASNPFYMAEQKLGAGQDRVRELALAFRTAHNLEQTYALLRYMRHERLQRGAAETELAGLLIGGSCFSEWLDRDGDGSQEQWSALQHEAWIYLHDPSDCDEDCGPYDPRTKGHLCKLCQAYVVECPCGSAFVWDKAPGEGGCQECTERAHEVDGSVINP